MTDEAIYCDPDLVRFYDWENPWPQDFDYFASLANGSERILDLGCGTGIFSAELAARGHRVTGVDPAAAMLDIARNRRGGEAVEWIEADARTLEINQRFDMVLMTGHAFQTLLTRTDRAATIRAIARHLVPEGKFFFDSRNPEVREWDKWTPENTRAMKHHPDFGMVEHWKDAQYNEADGVVTYGTFYRLDSGKLISAHSQIAAAQKDEIAQLLEQAGLSVDRWIGDYVGNEFGPGSPEIIPLGKIVGK